MGGEGLLGSVRGALGQRVNLQPGSSRLLDSYEVVGRVEKIQDSRRRLLT